MACRIVFMGTPAFAVPSLVSLRERPDLCEVVAVVCQPDKPAGRGRQVTPAPVKTEAMAMGLPVHEPTKMKSPETADLLRGYQPDLLVVAAYGRILPPTLLAIARRGAINVHASLLPRHRGASPIAHAILAGDRDAGVCIMQMDEGLDTGPVFSRAALPIAADDTCGSLTIKLAQLGAKLLLDSLPSIASGAAVAEAQPAHGSTYAPLLQKNDGRLNPGASAAHLARQVRAFNPWPGAFLLHAGGRIGVLRAHASVDPSAAAAGTVLHASSRGVEIACGEGTLWLDEVKPEGRRAMPAAAWVAGRGVSAGDVLGASSMENP